MIPIPDELARAAWAQTWQVTLLIAAVAVSTRILASNRPHLAHALWLVVLLKLLTPPLLCSSSGVFCWMQATFQQEPIEVVSTAPPEPTEPTEPLPAVAEMALPPPLAAGRILSASIEVDRTEEVRRPVATVPAVVIQTVEPAPGRLTSILLGVWLFGAFATLGVSGLRLAICLRRVRRNALPVDDAYRRMLDRLTRRLRLRRRVRLLITASRIGPAVVGLLRPTVLLPEVVVRGKTPDQLEPILAHELLHIRRGDLWVGALQAAARCLWWFHPMVWTADRLISREAERCCDEAVLAELGCSPSRYARSLFDVLERKQILKPLPAFPGVRPVEVTSRRLERIMSLGHGSHKRSPWWCWMVMLLAAAVTLPGAALVVGADEQETPDVGTPDVAPSPAEDEGSSDENVPGPRPLPGRELPPPRVARSDVNSTNVPSQQLPQWNYHVEDLITSIRQQRGLNVKKAKELLLCMLSDPGFLAPGDVQRPKRSVTWIGDHTFVTRDTLAGHRRMSARIEAWRALGISEITIEARWITAPAQVLDELEVDWIVSVADVAADDVSDSPTSPHVSRREHSAESFVGLRRTVREKSHPMTFSIIDEEQADALVEHLETLQGPLPNPIPDLPADAIQDVYQAPAPADPDTLFVRRGPDGRRPQVDGPFRQAIRAMLGRPDVPSEANRVRVLAAPKVTLFSGQSATICDGSQSPFVVAVKRIQGENGETVQPVIRIVDEGLKLQLRAELLEGGGVRLECSSTLSKILGVETAVIERDSRGEPTLSVQVPEVETISLDTAVELYVGQMLLIGGLSMGDVDGVEQAMLLMIHLAEVTPLLDSVEQVAPLPTESVSSITLIEEKPTVSEPMTSNVDPISPGELRRRWGELRERQLAAAREKLSLLGDGTVPVSETNTGSMIYFIEGSTKMLDGEESKIGVIAGEVRDETWRIEVRGHTTARPLGDDSPYRSHQDLAYGRAFQVRQKLIRLGIDVKHIRLTVSGANEPLHTGHDPEKLKQNARVEIYQFDGADQQRPAWEPSSVTRVYIYELGGAPQQPPAREPDYLTAVYSVDSLVRPLPPKVIGSPHASEEKPPVCEEDFHSLMELIITAVFPVSWDAVGGQGTITADRAKHRLVIRQTNEVHEEIVDLLFQLRSLQERKIQLDIEFLHVPREIVDAIGADVDPANDDVTLSPREARLLRAFVEKTDEAGIRKLASTTTYNGQLAKLTVSPVSEDSPPEGKTISIQAVVNSDEDQLRLTLVVPPDKTLCVSVPDGRTALIDVTEQFPPEHWVTGLPTSATPVADGSRLFRQQPPDWKNQRTFILVTPRTIVQEQEEQRLGIVFPFGMGTARIIIPEEEEDRLGITVPD